MKLIGNNLNGRYVREIVSLAKQPELTQIDLAVAYVQSMDSLFELAEGADVPLNLYALVDGQGFPHLDIVRRFVNGKRLSMRLFLTRDFYHPKVMWFHGVGAYIGSANLSGRAWNSNAECGVWLTHNELVAQAWDVELTAIFGVIRSRCREAKEEDLVTLERLEAKRFSLTAEERAFQFEVDQALADVPGSKSPHNQTRADASGLARAAFLKQWNQGLTVLRKITGMVADHKEKWPAWVRKDAHPAVVQDQVTEWWWETEFRASGESRLRLQEAHARNQKNPESVVKEMIRKWSGFEGGEKWDRYINEHPIELRSLLSMESLRKLDETRLSRIVFLCHSTREHARQVSNKQLGLSDERRDVEERAKIFARFLLDQSSEVGRHVAEVLFFALWGDKAGADIDGAARIWTAARDEGWHIPHLGRHMLGELIGYARPDEYPPRNNRVIRTLFALGFGDIEYE